MEIVEQAKAAANKIESVVKRVLDFSRPSLPRLVSADINIPIKEALNLSRTSLRKAGILVETSLLSDLPKVFIDSQLIEQVMLNLINNATEAMKDVDDKRMRVTSHKEGDNVKISISDSGKGVPPEIREKIFDPFYTTKSGGAGIGLCLCQRIVSDHGGSIEVFPSEYGGARFEVTIPVEKRKRF